MGSSKKTATLVGVVFIFSISLFIFMSAMISRFKFGDEGFNIKVKYRFLNNLQEGAPVRVAGGITVGIVEKIYQDPIDLKAIVELNLNRSLQNKLPKKGTTFAIYSKGLMGDQYVNITVPPLEEGAEIINEKTEPLEGLNPPSIDEMMIAFSSWFKGKNGGQVLAEIVQATQLFVNNLNAIVSENRSDIRLTVKQARTSFTNLSTQLDVLMAKLNTLTTNFSDISNKNKQDIQVMLANMSLISKDLNSITKRINSGRGSVGRLLKDEGLYNNASEAVRHAKELMILLRKKPWVIVHKQN